MRLSRVIALCNDQKPELILPYIELLLNLLIRTKNNAIIRNILYVFQKSWKKLNEDDFGKLLDKCFNYLENPKAEAAHRIYALNIIFESTSKYPEIKNELKNIIEFHYDEGSAGFKASCRNTLKQLKK